MKERYAEHAEGAGEERRNDSCEAEGMRIEEENRRRTKEATYLHGG